MNRNKRFFGNVSVHLSEETSKIVHEHDEVNWSAICRQAIIAYAAILPKRTIPLEEVPVREQ